MQPAHTALQGLLVASLGLACLLAGSANGQQKFWTGPAFPPAPDAVVEYFNPVLQHYFYTRDRTPEAEALDAGGFGGWVRTGLVFYAYASVEASQPLPGGMGTRCDLAPNPCVPVHRFYGPGPNSHFFTADAQEARILSRPGSGWIPEGIAFHAVLPDAANACATPVYRLYNNRWMFNDSSHRFTPSARVRQRLIDEGWIDEGVAFCSQGPLGTAPIERLEFSQPDPAGVMAEATCRDPRWRPKSCIAVGNLPVPRVLWDEPTSHEARLADPFNARTMLGLLGTRWDNEQNVNIALTDTSREAAAANAFVQVVPQRGEMLGLHLATPDRGPSAYSGLAAVRNLGPDEAFFPWRERFGTEYELVLGFSLNLKILRAAEGSHGYGVSMLEFVDITTGRSVLFNLLAHGTVAAGEFAGRDLKTGKVIVASAFGPQGTYGRAHGAVIREVPPFAYWGIKGDYQAWMNRDEFRVLLAAARGVDPLLSPDPASYRVDSFSFVNEAFGDAEIGMSLFGLQLSQLPRR